MQCLILTALMLSIAACCSPSTNKASKEITTDRKEKETVATSNAGDTVKNDNASRLPTRKIDSLLLEPFDLYAYKQKKRGSNSSGESRKSYFFKPDTVGMYYSYFLFHLPTQKYIGHDPNDPTGTSRNSGGREITVFKPDDEDQNQYGDRNETLIEFTQWYNDTDLPELAFVGWDVQEIKDKFGAPDFIKGNSYAYAFKNRALLFHISQGKVNWLKYVHANCPVKENSRQELFKKDVFGM